MFTQGRVDLLQFHGALRHARLQNLLVAFEGIDQLVLRRHGLGRGLFALQELWRHGKSEQKREQRLEGGEPGGQQGLVLDLGVARVAQQGRHARSAK